MVAARAARPAADADDHISEARQIIRYAHHVAVPVELCDGTTAVGRAETVQIPDDHDERSRVGHHWVDVARGWVLHGDRRKALDALNHARYLCPQQTRYHPSVRETVHAIAEADRRATDSLTGFARWADVTI